MNNNRKKSNPSNNKKRSLSPQLKSSSAKKMNATQPLKRTSKIQQQNNIIRKNHQSRQKLTKTLDTYTLLIRSNNPIRCLVHNCNISMYCQTQQKLLCANCIFGRSQHKFHRVTPVDKSSDKIEKDIETMNRLIDRELLSIKTTAQLLNKNLIQDQNDTHSGLASLIKIYQECHRLLQQSFIKSKESILLNFEHSRTKYEEVAYELKRLHQDYSTSNVLQNASKGFKNDQLLLYQHSVSSAIVSQRKIEEKDFVFNKRAIKTITTEQKKKIFGVLDLLRKINSK